MFNLTKQERQVALFIFTVALAGLGVNYFLKIRQQPQLLFCFNKNLGKLDLNTADAASLMKLPDIGEKLAARILELRREKGGFEAIEQLMSIKGMTAQRFNKLKGLVFVGSG
jgi:competence ComEA-like helix-hairpin-helix protein